MQDEVPTSPTFDQPYNVGEYPAGTLDDGESDASTAGGFTIVELLIVIVVIAVLATITIVSYNGITNRAVEASMMSDLNSAATQLEVIRAETGSYPESTVDINGGQGLKASGDYEIQYIPDRYTDGFCLEIGHVIDDEDNGPYFDALYSLDSRDGVIVEDDCLNVSIT